MTAESIATALGGRRVGNGWIARCPAHDDRTPSLSILDADDRTVLVHCHAGCEQDAVIAALRSRGLWSEKRMDAARFVRSKRNLTGNRNTRTQAALQIWRAASPSDDTLVEVYLKARGITIPRRRS